MENGGSQENWTFGLTPQLLFISWPNTEDKDSAKLHQGLHAAGGERGAVICDPIDPEISPPGCVQNELHGEKQHLMENVLHDADGGTKCSNVRCH